METLAYICEDSLEGMLSAVFKAYEHREFPDDISGSGSVPATLGRKDPLRADRYRPCVPA